MLKEFNIGFENPNLNTWDIKHIQYNLLKRLNNLKYVSYKRIDIILVKNTNEQFDCDLDFKKTTRLRVSINEESVTDLMDNQTIKVVYDYVFEGLDFLWKKNIWDLQDLLKIQEVIKAENFFVDLVYDKGIASPDRKHKAEFYCILHPGYTEYNFRVLYKKEVVRNVFFLKGHPDPGMFFGFFKNTNWRDNSYFIMSDINKEIFYVFNIHNEDFSIEYRPDYNSLEQCQKHVQAFGMGLSSSERMKLLGM